jgi:bifunctional non-homologous end joining protein LigD
MTTRQHSRFIIVRHDAIRAKSHHDLRFQIPNHSNKMWMSFAVPQGVPEKTGLRVLAIRTNLHTEEDALFTGVIPVGSYGAGTLKEVDSGPCIIEAYEPGKKFAITLQGRKYKGLYYMINAGNIISRKKDEKQNYILFKSKSELKA